MTRECGTVQVGRLWGKQVRSALIELANQAAVFGVSRGYSTTSMKTPGHVAQGTGERCSKGLSWEEREEKGRKNCIQYSHVAYLKNKILHGIHVLRGRP